MLLERFTKLNESINEDWRRPLLYSIERLNKWWGYIESGTGLELFCEFDSNTSLQPALQYVEPSIKLLLDAADPSTDWENASEEIRFIFELNNELQLTVMSSEVRRKDPNEIISTFYRLMRNNAYAALAVLALYDVHLDQFVKAEHIGQGRPLELMQDVFLAIAEGMKTWALRKRWTNVYQISQNRGELQTFDLDYRGHEKERQTYSQELLDDLEENYKKLGIKTEFYNITLTELYTMNLTSEDRLRSVFLTITCPDLPTCYLAEDLMERHGIVQNRFSRKSLYYPEENGAKRLQIGIRLPKNNCLVIARIGTEETHKYNEWGRLLDFKPGQLVSLFKENDRSNHLSESKSVTSQIVVFNTSGEPVSIEKDSTVADFIVSQYPMEDARHVVKAYINASQASLDQEIQAEDVVRIVVDKEYRQSLPVEAWLGNHQSQETLKVVADIERSSQTAAAQGRNRIILMLQSQLRHRGFSIDPDRIITILNSAGISVTKTNQDRVFEELSMNTSHDETIARLAIQYCLHERLRSLNDERPTFKWGEIRIADCCRDLTVKDTVIGTEDYGPRNPENPRHGHFRELRIHRMNCPYGPKRNLLLLKWADDEQSKQRDWGIRAGILFEDYEGSLIDILGFVETELRLTVHYVSADAINIGKKLAQVILIASARSEIERDISMSRIRDKYSNQMTDLISLTPRESRKLRHSRGCPYIINSDPEVGKYSPFLIVGRHYELNSLKSSVMDPNINQIVIVGYYRNGKTWLLKLFLDSFNLPDRIPIYISFDAPPDKFSPENIINTIFIKSVEQIYKRTGPSFSHYFQKEIQRPKTWFQLANWLREMSQITGSRFIFLMDEFSGIYEWISQKLVVPGFPEQFVSFMNDCSKFSHFILVFQATDFHNLGEGSNNFVKWFRSRSGHQIEILPFDHKEIGELLTIPVKGAYDVSPDAIDLAMQLTGGNPFLSALLGKTIWNAVNRNEYEYIDVVNLKQIVEREVVSRPDWDAYLFRLIEKLSGTTLKILQMLAQKQLNDQNDPTKPWSFLKWAVESSINQQIFEIDSDPFPILAKLKTYALIEEQVVDSERAWRLKSQLLALYLVNY